MVFNIYNDRIEITSPGGMYSGKVIPSVVESVMESKRRNPVIADLFHRMHLMNRRGSGLANITNRTNVLFNDGQNHVKYRSNEEFFVVIIDNANYGVKKETNNDTNIDTNIVLSKNEKVILNAIKSDNASSVNQIAEFTGLSRSTVFRSIKKLKELNYIIRRGNDYFGYWEVIK